MFNKHLLTATKAAISIHAPSDRKPRRSALFSNYFVNQKRYASQKLTKKKINVVLALSTALNAATTYCAGQCTHKISHELYNNLHGCQTLFNAAELTTFGLITTGATIFCAGMTISSFGLLLKKNKARVFKQELNT